MRKPEWFDNDAFWADHYPNMFPESRFEEALAILDKVLALAPGLKNAASILDLCCGPGRFAIPLAGRGYHVTAVDRTKFLLEEARKRERIADHAGKDSAPVEWVCADMRDFARPAAFDLVLSLYTSFGYFENPEEDKQVLRNMHDSLRPGGTAIIDVFGKEVLARVFQPASYDVLPDGTRFVSKREVFENWTRVRNEWTIIRDGRATIYPFHHVIYSGQELKQLLLNAGFAKVSLFGSFDQKPYDMAAQRLIAVAVK